MPRDRANDGARAGRSRSARGVRARDTGPVSPSSPDRPPPPRDRRPAAIVAILAGGRSRRMGVPKAGVLLDGTPLLAHATRAATQAGLRPVVVAKRTSELPPVPDLERWDEPDDPVHPLAGVAAALRRADAPVVVLPVDLPRVPGGLLRVLAERPEPLVVVEAAGRVHPLLARATPGCADAFATAADAGDPVVATVRSLGASVVGDRAVAAWGTPATLLANVNRPADLGNGGARPDDG